MSGFDRVADARTKNARLRQRLEIAQADRGYLTVYLGGEKVHAAASLIRGHSGYLHPRAFCQPHTPRTYASEYDPIGDDRAVTCERCLASMAKHGVPE